MQQQDTLRPDDRSNLRVAILGTGMIGEVHRRAALLAGAEIVGAMASTPARSESIAARWKTAPIRSLDELKGLAPDLVHVCSPNALHPEHVEAAFHGGAHVICEKPLAVNSPTAQRLYDLAQNLNLVATVPFVYRFHPLVREIRARSLAGDFGEWQLLHGSYLQDWLLSPFATSWRVDSVQGGASRTFADIGSHWCDLMEFVTGERIASVCAAMSTTIPERPATSTSTFGSGDLPPANRASRSLVKFVFGEEDEHEEALYGTANHRVSEGSRGRYAGQGTVQEARVQ
ncbi:Gfo/Idh/MocA family protein [Burkholderia multivorans]|uniref:Gfo/Idh/MocA family protein n=1 Tax=Burkholderia multivorans TaxID=87883 RepID=UPI0020189ABB|nr:Gfo/Idh/MocA family oxidoreductase [Burkholderia multivorans]MCO1368648.1 Gfo/Idh/MocA family oxidoreductase [Burkholderia multivorans]MCO1380539.1 Gfo/Idh/MocA family oxidoreductase [Burkholderia multivorans]UQP22034.1 Gfo/Idh/MocA family oxidoreductase [Burkholderia multivorans]UQP91518.1 Gfo/Idh/MocA family oxidoreductase [Burkholderia multivorans]